MNTRSLNYLFTGLIAFGFISCTEKDLPEPKKSEVPMFTISGEIDGDVFEYTVGLDACVGAADVSDDTANNIRYWQFIMTDPDNFIFPNVVISIFQKYEDGQSLEDGLLSTILPDHSYEFLNPDLPPVENQPVVALQFSNKQNKVYFSDGFSAQPDSSFFKSSGVKDLVKDGKNYRQMKCTFQCEVTELTSSDPVWLKNGKATIVMGGF